MTSDEFLTAVGARSRATHQPPHQRLTESVTVSHSSHASGHPVPRKRTSEPCAESCRSRHGTCAAACTVNVTSYVTCVGKGSTVNQPTAVSGPLAAASCSPQEELGTFHHATACLLSYCSATLSPTPRSLARLGWLTLILTHTLVTLGWPATTWAHSPLMKLMTLLRSQGSYIASSEMQSRRMFPCAHYYLHRHLAIRTASIWWHPHA